MKNLSIFLLTMLHFFCLPTFGQSKTNSSTTKILYETIHILSSDSMEGRLVGSKAEKKSAQYIQKQFEQIELSALFDKDYFHSFDYDYNLNPHQNTDKNIVRIKSQNVIAYLDNNAPTTIVIGAHYDHIGRNEYRQSTAVNSKNEIHNGADDNASGIAGVIALAQKLKNNKIKENCNYIFACFSGEEIGLIGSKKLSKKLTEDYKKPIRAMINMDMIGRMDSNKNLYIGGIGTASTLGKIINNNKPADFKLNIDSSGIGPSDHTSFYLENIPVLFFFTGTHTDYHKPTDDIEKINFIDLDNIVEYIYQISMDLAEQSQLDFVKTKNKSNKKGTKFTVSLGIMPNYESSTTGLKIDAVIDGKIADQAGLLKGDKIVRIDDNIVSDIYSYMEALSKYKKGDNAKIRIVRNENFLNFKIVF